jgi:5,6-dimethylbenzimidazole synthase
MNLQANGIDHLMPEDTSTSAPQFSDEFRSQFRQLLLWRRDVRRFRPEPVDPRIVTELLNLACLAPSVGNSQPWRFVIVNDPRRRAQVLETFRRCNEDALAAYSGERALLYSKLKLSGLAEAPCHLAVFVDGAASAGGGLGRRTMPETLQYSAVAAIQVLWLAARAHGLGVGWVSILDPAEVVDALDVPSSWSLVAYLCVGYPEEEHLDPELERHGWQQRADVSQFILQR